MKQWTLVSSSNLEAVSFSLQDGQTGNGELHIMFKGNKHYVFYDVPIEVYNELVLAESVGKYFHANVRDKYKHGIIG